MNSGEPGRDSHVNDQNVCFESERKKTKKKNMHAIGWFENWKLYCKKRPTESIIFFSNLRNLPVLQTYPSNSQKVTHTDNSTNLFHKWQQHLSNHQHLLTSVPYHTGYNLLPLSCHHRITRINIMTTYHIESLKQKPDLVNADMIWLSQASTSSVLIIFSPKEILIRSSQSVIKNWIQYKDCSFIGPGQVFPQRTMFSFAKSLLPPSWICALLPKTMRNQFATFSKPFLTTVVAELELLGRPWCCRF